MHLITRPTTCRHFKIVFWDADHTFFTTNWANLLLHMFLEHEVRVEASSLLSSTAASDCDRNSVKPEKGATSGGPFGSAAFTGIGTLSIMACVLWSHGGCTLVGFAQGLTWL